MTDDVPFEYDVEEKRFRIPHKYHINGHLKKDGQDYAIVYVTCDIKEGTSTSAVIEEYILAKENEQWKILGWQSQNLSDNTSETTE